VGKCYIKILNIPELHVPGIVVLKLLLWPESVLFYLTSPVYLLFVFMIAMI
jgi:hypothetical protein